MSQNTENKSMGSVLSELSQVLEARKQADAGSSYVASLHHKGINAILKKVAEEAGEVLIAAKDESTDDLVYEVADLWFHTLVLLSHKNTDADAVLQELKRRLNLSGLEEKASRTPK